MIAVNTNYDVPIIIGDLLVSGSVKTKRFILPSLGQDIIQHIDESVTTYPIRLTQKIYILKDNLCIAFAGSLVYIKRFLEDIKLFCKYHDSLTIDILKKWLEEYEHDTTSDISVLILLAHNDGENTTVYQAVHGNWKTASSAIYETTWAAGSGAQSYLQESVRDYGFQTTFKPGEWGYALQSNIILTSSLLAKERLTLSTVSEYWGAGFEIAYFDGVKFQKFDDMAYVIFQAWQNEDGSLAQPVPALLMHYKYVGEVLLITVIDLHKGQTAEVDDDLVITSRHFDVTRFVVTPIDYAEEIDLERYQFDTSFEVNKMGMGYIFQTEKGHVLPASFYAGEQMKIQYNHLEHLEITMHRRMNDEVVDAVNNWLKRSAS